MSTASSSIKKLMESLDQLRDENKFEETELPISEDENTAAQLEEIAAEIVELCETALGLIDDRVIRERSRSYWYGHIMSATGNDNYPTSFYSMMDAVEDLQSARYNEELSIGEATPNDPVAKRIDQAYGAFADLGDEGLDYLEDHAPLYSKLLDRHDYDLGKVITREPRGLLMRLADELESLAQDKFGEDY